jgi:hypothetical protein
MHKKNPQTCGALLPTMAFFRNISLKNYEELGIWARAFQSFKSFSYLSAIFKNEFILINCVISDKQCDI